MLERGYEGVFFDLGEKLYVFKRHAMIVGYFYMYLYV